MIRLANKSMMFRLCLAAVLSLPASGARADDRADCRDSGGFFLTGVVVSEPRFAPGHDLHGVQLSHTKFRLSADQDGKAYEVAADNVFAPGYDRADDTIPAPLDRIHRFTRVELCGEPYTRGLGVHWVHTNCNDPSHPDGWLKLIGPTGPGENLEGNTEYCRLWSRTGR